MHIYDRISKGLTANRSALVFHLLHLYFILLTLWDNLKIIYTLQTKSHIKLNSEIAISLPISHCSANLLLSFWIVQLSRFTKMFHLNSSATASIIISLLHLVHLTLSLFGTWYYINSSEEVLRNWKFIGELVSFCNYFCWFWMSVRNQHTHTHITLILLYTSLYSWFT